MPSKENPERGSPPGRDTTDTGGPARDRSEREGRQVENYWQVLDDLEVYREELGIRADQLAEAQSRLETLEELLVEAPIGYVSLDSSGTIRECNHAAARLLGIDAAHASGWPLASFVRFEHRKRFSDHLAECRRGTGTVRTELTLQGDGDIRMPCQLVTRHGGACDDPRVYRTAILDLSDRKRIEEALQRSERRFSAAVEASGTGVFEIEVPFQGLLYLSNRLADLFGYSRSELAEPAKIPDWIEQQLHPADRDPARRAFEDLSSGRKAAFEGDVRFRHRDGSWRWIRLWTRASAETEEAGRYLIGAAMDVTSEKERVIEIERRAGQLRALAAELYQVEERERRELATELHDNLAQLIVATKMKLGVIGSHQDPPSLRQQVDEALSLLDRADESVRSLTFSLSPPVLDELGLGAAVKWLAKDMQKQFGLSVELATKGEVVVADPRVRFMLFRSIRELLINAAKHARTSKARVVLEANERSIRVEVVDEGQGFELERARAEGSTGFGLFSIQERVESIGGTMDVRSAPRRGTTVTLLLDQPEEALVPASPGESSPASGSPAPAATGGRERIRVLLADDHEMVRSALARLLEAQSDLQVIGEASDGESAIELVTLLGPDVILMDVTMNGLGGIEATRRIAREHPEARVIGLSMHESGDVASAMRDAGAFEYLRKSSPTHVLLDTIRKAARQPRA